MDDLFKEINNPREKNLIQEAKDLLDDVTKQCESGREILELHKKKNEKLISGIKEFLHEYRQKNDRLRMNYDAFRKAVDEGNAIKSLSGLEFEDLFDVPVDTTTSSKDGSQGNKSQGSSKQVPSWFREFRRDEFEAMRENLENLTKKLYKARVEEDLVKERDVLSSEIDEMIDELQIDYQPFDWEVPKDKLIRIEKHIQKLMQFDIIIPTIIADVLNKASEFARSLYNNFQEFRSQTSHLHQLISAYQIE